MPLPHQPKIYHILHVDRLPSILAASVLYSDAEVRRRGLGGTTVGMQKLKDDRLTLPVPCHPDTMVGDYVPFYFCSRSVMLFLLHKGNHENLDYRGGQEPIITLECDLSKVVAEADKAGHRWAFSLGNAAAVGGGSCVRSRGSTSAHRKERWRHWVCPRSWRVGGRFRRWRKWVVGPYCRRFGQVHRLTPNSQARRGRLSLAQWRVPISESDPVTLKTSRCRRKSG